MNMIFKYVYVIDYIILNPFVTIATLANNTEQWKRIS